MRTSILAMTVAFGTAIAVPALAQKSMAPVEPQIQSDKQMQDEADKGIKTRDSGASGFVGQQERPGASAHPPGKPSQTTTGSGASPSSGSATGASPR